MVGMRIWPRSKAQRDREQLAYLGRCYADGLRKGIESGEAWTAARPDDVSLEEWRLRGLDEVMAELDANPQHQRMVAAAQMMLGVDDSRSSHNSPRSAPSLELDLPLTIGDRIRVPVCEDCDDEYYNGTVTQIDGDRVFMIWDDGPNTPTFDRWFTPDPSWSRVPADEDELPVWRVSNSLGSYFAVPGESGAEAIENARRRFASQWIPDGPGRPLVLNPAYAQFGLQAERISR